MLASLPALLTVDRSEVVLVADLEDARRLALQLDPSASDVCLDERASDILAGRVLVVRRQMLPVLDTPSRDHAPRLGSLMEGR